VGETLRTRWTIGTTLALVGAVLLLVAPFTTLFAGDAYFMFGYSLQASLAGYPIQLSIGALPGVVSLILFIVNRRFPAHRSPLVLLALGGLAAAGAAVAVLALLPDREFVVNKAAALRFGAQVELVGGLLVAAGAIVMLLFDGSTRRSAAVLRNE
jgi:hypothetical protein